MTSQCSVAVLESALAGSLPAEDEATLHHHLEECEECSTLLDRMVGGAAWYQEAAALLVEDELDDAVPTRDEWSAIDFTVEHLEPSDEPNVLGRLGGYDVLDIVGHGGNGVVLKAYDRELKRCVAIKVLAPHLARSSLAKKRFAREAQAAAAVIHPNVLAIYQVQPSGRLPFLVMPLVAGESLAQRLAAQGTLELKEILRIGMQAAAGLAAAHEQGLVHRDVKPANILLEKGVERAVLTDFGLARAADDATLTRWGIIAGTPQYMSPEQARGEPLDGRSDLFSLGCVLYEMATGVSPFRTETLIATMRRLVDESPQAMASLNPELPPWFIAIVDRLLEKEPSKRFNSAKEVSELLEGCLAHVQQPASVPLPSGVPKGSPTRKRGFFGTRGLLAHASGWHQRLPLLKKLRPRVAIALFAAFALVAWAVFAAVTEPPDIGGEWSGEDWGKVTLKAGDPGEYTGTYSETVGKQPGEIQLKWSRIERRFNGTWHEGKDRLGELSVRLVGDEIRGALTTDAKSKINPATPHLADFAWTRAQTTNATSDIPWGEWNVSWSIRLRPAKTTWAADELPEFTIDLRKRETGEPDALRPSLHNWLLEVDGKRYRLAIFTTSWETKQTFEPGMTKLDFIPFHFQSDDETGLHIRTGKHAEWINSFSLDPVGKNGQVMSQPKPEDRLRLNPGKHIVRIAAQLTQNPPAAFTESELAHFAFSNPVEVEIQGGPPTVSVAHPMLGEVTDHEDYTGHIEAGDPLHIVWQMDERTFLRLRRAATEANGGKELKPDWAANMPVFYGSAEEKGPTRETKVKSVDNHVDANGTVRWDAEIPQNDRRALFGMLVQVRLITSPPRKSLLIPESAIGSDQDRKYVYLVDDKNVVQQRKVIVGQFTLTGDLREVKSGLTKDDRVVVSDIRGLQPGMTVQPRVAAGKGTPYTRTYAVGDLVYPMLDLKNVRSRSKPGTLLAIADFDTLIQRIVNTVSPQTWEQHGGQGTVVAYPINLNIVVSQTKEVHEELERFLEHIRLHDTQVSLETRFVAFDADARAKLGVDFDSVTLDRAKGERLMAFAQDLRDANLVQAPKVTLFYGQTMQYSEPPKDFAPLSCKVQAVVSKDRSKVQLTVAVGNSEKESVVVEVNDGDFAVVNLSRRLPAVNSEKAAGAHERQLLLLVRPQIIVLGEEEEKGGIKGEPTAVPPINGSATQYLRDAQLSVIKAKLQQAKTEAARLEAAFKTGYGTEAEFLAAKDKVTILEAELTGDPIAVAEAKLAGARERLQLVTARYQAGMMTGLELEQAKEEVAEAEAELRLAKVSAKSTNATNEPQIRIECMVAEVPADFKLTAENMDRAKLGQNKNVNILVCPTIMTVSGQKGEVTIDGGPGVANGIHFALEVTATVKSGRIEYQTQLKKIVPGETIASQRDGTTNWGEPVLFGPFDLANGHKLVGSLTFKSVPTATPSTPTVGKTMTFGPTIERTLPFSAPYYVHSFQFHSGDIYDLGHGPDTTKEQSDADAKLAEAAERSGGLDMMVLGGEDGFRITGRGCIFVPVDAKELESHTPAQAFEQLQRAWLITGVLEIKTKDCPAYYLFKTAAGECGWMSVRGQSEDKTGMKFRYKLVPSATAKAPVPGAKNPFLDPIQKFTLADKVITESMTSRDGAWTAEVKTPQTLQLFEIADPQAKDCTVYYRAKLRTKDFQGKVYLQMWYRLPRRGENLSHGQVLTGSTDWVSCETVFVLNPGEHPDLIRLNVIAQGTGTVQVKDVELLRGESAGSSGAQQPSEPPTGNLSKGGPPTVTVAHPTVDDITHFFTFDGRIEGGEPLRLVFEMEEATYLWYKREAIQTAGGRDVKPGWEINMPVRYHYADEKGHPHDAKITSVHSYSTPKLRMFRWEAEIPQSDKTAFPGVGVNLRLIASPPRKGLLLPECATATDELGQPYVYTVDGKNAVRRGVKTGQTVWDQEVESSVPMREITKGLTSDDRVIVSDIREFRPGLTVLYQSTGGPSKLVIGPEWSKPTADGLQIRATISKDHFGAEETPVVKLDLRNTGTKPVDYNPLPQLHCQIIVDGQWYLPGQIVNGAWDLLGPVHDKPPLPKTMKPGEERLEALSISLDDKWFQQPEGTKGLKLALGTHEVRIAFHPEANANDDQFDEIMSNPLMIEIERALSEKTQKDVGLAFGPVMERTVNDLDEGRDDFLNLETGKLIEEECPVTVEVGDYENEKLTKWAEKVGADVVGAGHGLKFFDGFASETEKWDDATAESVVKAVRATERKIQAKREHDPPLSFFQVVQFSVDAKPTFVFQTRKGSMGILQFTGTAEQPFGVKFRYKLVQGGDKTADSTPIAATKAYTGELRVYRNYRGSVAPEAGEAAKLKVEGKPAKIPVTFTIPETDVQQVVTKLRAKQPLMLEAFVTGMKKAGEGQLVSVADQIDPNNGTLKCQATIVQEGDAVLLPNMSLNIRLLLEVKPKVVLLTMNAINNGDRGAFVHLIKANDTIAIQPVKLGDTDSSVVEVQQPANRVVRRAGSGGITDVGVVEIEQGVSAGDIVALVHAGELKEGQTVRYKLVQNSSSLPSANSVGTAAVFGPERECVLPFSESEKIHYFQFFKGEVFQVGHGPGTNKAEIAKDWKKVEDAGNADIDVTGADGSISINRIGCILIRNIQPLNWDAMDAKNVADKMKIASFNFDDVVVKTKDFPVTYLFKIVTKSGATTREVVGVMQLLGVVDDKRDDHAEGATGHGLKFRYKLVEAGETEHGGWSEKTQNIVKSLLANIDSLQIMLEHRPFKQPGHRSLWLGAEDRPSDDLYLRGHVTKEQLKKLVLRLAADGFFDRASVPGNHSSTELKNSPGYFLILEGPVNIGPLAYWEDLSQPEGAALKVAKELRAALDGDAAAAADTIIGEMRGQAGTPNPSDGSAAPRAETVLRPGERVAFVPLAGLETDLSALSVGMEVSLRISLVADEQDGTKAFGPDWIGPFHVIALDNALQGNKADGKINVLGLVVRSKDEREARNSELLIKFLEQISKGAKLSDLKIHSPQPEQGTSRANENKTGEKVSPAGSH